MRTFTLIFSALVLGTTAMKAQTVATFEGLSLATADTYYVNYSAPMADVGFNNGLAHFPCVYDTSWGGEWSSGFAYSNMTDSVTSSYTNEYSAKTAIGYGGSAKYAAVHCADPVIYSKYSVKAFLTGAAIGKTVNGFYVTNSTYAYNDMKNGNPPFSKKFGGATGTDPDWFMLTVKGYSGGSLKPDSVDFYLADFRPVTSSNDSIVKSWQWVNLLPLGNVDSLQFELRSSDTGSFGMNTPAYFCMDNFTTNETSVGVNETKATIAKVYPNPASNMLYVDIIDNSIKQVSVRDVTGKVMNTVAVSNGHIEINTSSLVAGIYILQLEGDNRNATVRFQKQ